MGENTDQNNSDYWHFLYSDKDIDKIGIEQMCKLWEMKATSSSGELKTIYHR